ncbi:hypothetical protein JTF08_13705 [Micrococcaceae bacterium RIT802]|nr:hypothetical protein [Micrococcaceae bacterium RIT 802]
MANLADRSDLVAAWRPLRPDEETRADYWLGAASRRILREWPDVETRITAGTLKAEDVQDVVVHMVLRILQGPDVAGAKSWSVAAGAESRSVTLAEARGEDLLTIEGWMLDVFEGPTRRQGTPLPVFHAPRSGRYDRLFQWSEEC